MAVYSYQHVSLSKQEILGIADSQFVNSRIETAIQAYSNQVAVAGSGHK